MKAAISQLAGGCTSLSLLPTKTKRLSRNALFDLDRIKIYDDFHTSSSEEEHDEDLGLSTEPGSKTRENKSNKYAILYKTFGRRSTRGGYLKDGVDVHFMKNGSCMVSDLLKNKLKIFSLTGKNSLSFHNEDTIEPWGIAFYEDMVLVTSRRKRLVLKLTHVGHIEEESFGDSFFHDPCGIAITEDKRIIVTDPMAKRVSVHEWGGDWLYDLVLPKYCGSSFDLPRYVTVSPTGETLVSDAGNHCVFVFDKYGEYRQTVGSYGTNDGELKSPYGVCCDIYGNIYIADHYNDRISYFTRDGTFLCHIVTRQDDIFHPQGISVSDSMKMYVTHGSLKAVEVMVFTLKPILRTLATSSTSFLPALMGANDV